LKEEEKANRWKTFYIKIGIDYLILTVARLNEFTDYRNKKRNKN